MTKRSDPPPTTQDQDLEQRRVRPAPVLASAAAALASLPGLWLRLGGPTLPHPVEALVYGLAIIGAAFLLSWAAEVAQLDISAGLALALLAMIAVLPEYAVDFVFAWRGGQTVAQTGPGCTTPDGTSPCSLALANMTGANRLLIGVGWSMVVLLAWWRHRAQGAPRDAVKLEPTKSVEVAALVLATAYSLTLPLRSTLTLLDAAVLISIFVVYLLRVAQAPRQEPHLTGPARLFARRSPARRRAMVALLFGYAAAVIVLVAEHFADALVASGTALGIKQFFLVQWVAPLASESPELLVAGMFAWRLASSNALGTLVSSKVNQWTLLVGSIPIVFAVASGSLNGLPMDPRQRHELLLTAAQSAFALSIMINLAISTRGALALFGLFMAQFVLAAVLPSSVRGVELTVLSVVYLVLAVVLLVKERRQVVWLLRNGWRTPFKRLEAAEPGPSGAAEAAKRS